jgi:hypothetical protein
MEKTELTEAEQACMLELNRGGTAEGMEDFPFDTTKLHRNCWLTDFHSGLTPREAIEQNNPYEPPALARNANGKFEYQVFASPYEDIYPRESPVFECDDDKEAGHAAADCARQWGVEGVELCRVRNCEGRIYLQIVEQLGFVEGKAAE